MNLAVLVRSSVRFAGLVGHTLLSVLAEEHGELMEAESDKFNSVLGELVHYYEVRMVALSEYSDRVWNRFNWFMTVEVAAFGFFFSQAGKIASQSLLQNGIPLVGIIVALLWGLLGAEDYVSMRKHGKITTDVEQKVKEQFERIGLTFDVEVRKSFVNFRQTWLLFLFPCLVAISWVVVFVVT
ncbi:RipA family octameric membrane protein [Vibrio quintilis]|nr:hypothetical protein [Vibrio quintilis]